MRIHQDKVQVGQQRPIDTTQTEITQLAQTYDSLKDQLLVDVRKQRQHLLQQTAVELDALKQAAQHQASEMVTAAQAECDTLHQSARDAGYQDGYQQGRVDGLTDVMQSAQALIANLKEAESRLFYSIRRDLAQMVETVCQQILHQQLQTHPEQWLAIVEAASQQCVDAKQVSVVLPEALVQELHALFPDSAHLHLLADRQLQPGQAFVITDKASLNFSLNTQIRTLLTATQPEHWVDPLPPESAETLGL